MTNTYLHFLFAPSFSLVGKHFTSSTLITIPIASRQLKLVCQRYFNYQLETWLPLHELVQYLFFSHQLSCFLVLHTHRCIARSTKFPGAVALINNVLFSSIWIIKGRVLRRGDTCLFRENSLVDGCIAGLQRCQRSLWPAVTLSKWHTYKKF